MKERRKYPRLAISINFFIDTKGPYTTENISEKGFFIPLYLDLLPLTTINRNPPVQVELTGEDSTNEIISGEAEFVRYRYKDPSGFAYSLSIISDEYVAFCQHQAKRMSHL